MTINKEKKKTLSENIKIHIQLTRPKRANALNMKNNYRRSERWKVFNPIKS